ncbi:uncharacterized protein LOC112507131 isoform X1 [Cynara cardunculus var. scolymus]|uniref:uncharacterized protein LOC112507131 isoform X1 n=1 Tax=Cynara cardunculus var. scolymus TaxID=59895 RepID=UPI000D62D741|nr:uncharacterized protein LOC112507131 isoform X1 [Cynara cardunculus var. scolymus]XP_024967336.1 uncharacterized protein LOC112507131 isoform X1 [Cynara cardunculus var. scolymus]
MNQTFTPQFKDNFCNNCGYQEPRFLHRVWYEDRIQSFCTSCILLSHKQSFCPTCLSFHDFNSEGMFIRCPKCLSFSHPSCFYSNRNSSEAPSMCSSCMNPNRLVSALKKFKARGDKGSINGMDKNIADLLLTAAKIATMSISKAAEASKSSAENLANKTVLAKKKAIAAINHVVEYVDREYKRYNVGEGNDDDDGPSLLDFSSDEDCSTETDEGEADYDIDNPSEDDAI